MLNKVLIANRGEIAVRIVRACAEMDIRSVAIYTEPDRYALHVKRADESYSLGEDPLAGYLDPLRIVNLALETGCDAIHPGYGFLSENATFARLCEEKGITFIGPKSTVIHSMGDKTRITSYNVCYTKLLRMKEAFSTGSQNHQPPQPSS